MFFDAAGAGPGVDETGAAVAMLEEVTRVLEPPAFSVMTDIRVVMLGLSDSAVTALPLFALDL